MQHDLFAADHRPSTWKRRVVAGFLQFQEVTARGERGPWHFVIYGFGNDDVSASVYDKDEQHQRVPWCEKRRAIKIGRRWYAHPHWKH